MSDHGKQETDQTVLTSTKVLTKTNNCPFRVKKVERYDNKTLRRTCLPHFQIRSGATDRKSCCNKTFWSLIFEAFDTSQIFALYIL